MSAVTRETNGFYIYFTELRHAQKVEAKDLAIGIYSRTMISRIENGERLPRKIVRDRLLARLGVCSDMYEDYLVKDEYHRWCQRQEIIQSILQGDISDIEEQLEVYKKDRIPISVEDQFIATIEYQLMLLKGATEEELYVGVEKAARCTMPNLKKGFPSKMVLAEQELDLLADYIRLRNHMGTKKQMQAWRIEQYQAIIAYMDTSRLSQIAKDKILPKVNAYLDAELSGKTTALIGNNFASLYVETGSCCVSELIHAKREELKLSRRQLSKNICSVKTVERLESGEASTTWGITRRLLERLGLHSDLLQFRENYVLEK